MKIRNLNLCFWGIVFLLHLNNNLRGQCNDVVSALINKTMFFTIQPPSPKIVQSWIKLTPKELSKRYTAQTDAWYADGCAHNTLFNNLVNAVEKYFTPAVINQLKKNATQPSVAIFDIDETLVSAYRAFYQNEVCSSTSQPVYLYSQIPAANNLIKIVPIERLYRFFIQRGFTVIFVCGRQETTANRSIILSNLKSCGFETFEHLYLKPTTDKHSTAQWKISTRELIAQNHTIVATIDDDWRNLQGDNLGVCAVWVPSLLTQKFGEDSFFESLVQAQQKQGLSHEVALQS